MRIALAQINSTLGDFEANRLKMETYIQRAQDRHCDVVVFPELSLFGYLPNDLLERDSIVEAQLKEFKKLEKIVPKGLVALVGLVTRNQGMGKPYHNSVAIIEKGKKTQFLHKQLLPTYDVFDEARYFHSGKIEKHFIKIKNKKVLILICEDMWAWGSKYLLANHPHNPILDLKKHKPKAIINLSASPFSVHHEKERHKAAQKTAKFFNAPLTYVNMVGAQDEIIFDGASFCMSPNGKIKAKCVQFEEEFNVFDSEKLTSDRISRNTQPIEVLYKALVLGIRDFASKVGIKRAHLGLSGGIDSALVACLAVDALGPSQVTALAMPGPFSSDDSFRLAKKLADNLKIDFKTISITESYDQMTKSLDHVFGKQEFSVTHENLQSRLRGLYLMALSNIQSSLLLSTSNKSEFATGYCTLYGDMNGGLAPLGDLLKGQVYDLAEYINREYELIPKEIITRAPSAELKPNQKDQDSLPSYDKLDKAVENIVEKLKPARSTEEKWLLKALKASEFKRWQSPPILRVSNHAFGRGRRVPIAHKALF